MNEKKKNFMGRKKVTLLLDISNKNLEEMKMSSGHNERTEENSDNIKATTQFERKWKKRTLLRTIR